MFLKQFVSFTENSTHYQRFYSYKKICLEEFKFEGLKVTFVLL